MPSWMLQGHDAILAVDIGGTNIRAGIVETKLKKAKDLSKAAVFASDLWRHGDEKTKRDEAVERLIDMLKEHIALAEKEGLKLAPVVGIGCPGIIREDGSIETRRPEPAGQLGKQPLQSLQLHPRGNSAHRRPRNRGRHPQRRGRAGPQRAASMQDYDRWGVLTIGTGLGNARYTNRRKNERLSCHAFLCH